MHDTRSLEEISSSVIESGSITTGMPWMKEELEHQKNPILVPTVPGPANSVSIKLTTYNPLHKPSVENLWVGLWTYSLHGAVRSGTCWERATNASVCTSIRNPFNTPGSESNNMQDVKGKLGSVL